MSGRTDLAQLVADAAQARPDRVALVEAEGRRLTWGELDDRVSRLATGLGDLGVVAGRRVGIVLGNSLEFVVAYFAILRAQAVAVPLNPRSSADEITRMLADSGCRFVFSDDHTLGVVRDAVTHIVAARSGAATDLEPDLVGRSHAIHVIAVGSPAGAAESAYDALLATPARPVPSLPDPERLAVLLYTSGASGRPRAVMLSHRAMLANIEQVAAVEPAMIHGDDVVLAVLPLFHVYGLNAVLGAVVRQQARLVLQARFDPDGTLDLIEDEACSVVPVAPAVFPHWLPLPDLAERLGPVQLVLSGSAPLSREVIERFTAATGVPVHQGYGLTEAAPVVTSTLLGDHEPGSIGAALEGVEVRLVDERGEVVEGDDPGEIEIRGDNLFSGYWPDGGGGPRADGWWPTGDVGFLDPAGDLVLVDRLKELVIVSGFNVYPHEVEAVILEVPGTREAAVIGVDDEQTGEAVVAYVVGDADAPGDLAEVVRAHAAGRLARFKQPTRIEIVDRLPTSVTGKVQKGRLRGVERRRALELLE